MTDIYSWILSPEIREYLRGNYRPTLMEQQALIRGAYKPIEEKLSALQELLGEVETEEDRIFLEKVIGVYQFAIREIRECRRDEFYFYRTAIQFGGDSGLFAFPFTYLGDTETGICRSYQWNSGKNESFYCPVSCGYQVEKWRCKGKWRPVLSFDRKPINEEYRTTRFYLYDTLMKQTKMTQEEWVKSYDPERPHPYLLPFSTGDLVYLDAPLFERPVYGVLCCWTSDHPDRSGERYMLLGYIENGRFRPMDLSGHDVAFGGSEYRVVDWLHSVSMEELPAGQEILGEIGAYLRRTNHQDWVAAKYQFMHIFVRSQNIAGYLPYRVQQAALAELVGNYCPNHPNAHFYK